MEKSQGDFYRLENLQLALPLLPAWVGTVPAPGLHTLCRLFLVLSPFPSQPCCPVPASLQPPGTWPVWDNYSCSCLPPKVLVVGGMELSGFSAHISTLVLTSETKGQLFLLSVRLSHRQGVCWIRCLLGSCRDPMQPSMWRTWEMPDSGPTCGQHLNLQQSFLYMVAVTL